MSGYRNPSLIAALMSMGLLSGEHFPGRGKGRLPGGKKKNRHSRGMRKAESRPWCSAERERRRRQIERGVLREESRGMRP